MNSDASKNLFDLKGNLTKGTPLRNMVYFRSTEYERTRVSGTQILSSLVLSVHPGAQNPLIELHMIDKKGEIMAPNRGLSKRSIPMFMFR